MNRTRANGAACSERFSADLNHTLNQLYQGMVFLYGGLAAGILYELLAIIRRRCAGRAPETVCDALYAILATFATAVCFLFATGGVLRLYGFLILALGWLLARWAFQPLIHVL